MTWTSHCSRRPVWLVWKTHGAFQGCMCPGAGRGGLLRGRGWAGALGHPAHSALASRAQPPAPGRTTVGTATAAAPGMVGKPGKPALSALTGCYPLQYYLFLSLMNTKMHCTFCSFWMASPAQISRFATQLPAVPRDLKSWFWPLLSRRGPWNPGWCVVSLWRGGEAAGRVEAAFGLLT